MNTRRQLKTQKERNSMERKGDTRIMGSERVHKWNRVFFMIRCLPTTGIMCYHAIVSSLKLEEIKSLDKLEITLAIANSNEVVAVL